jgi:DNA-binding GntR family transcriptional regulator
MVAEKTLESAVYQELLHRLLSGSFLDKGIISARDLSRALGVSRTPINDALKRLAAEGYLVALPRKGYRLALPRADEVASVFRVRSALEEVAAELVAQARPPLAPLRQAQNQCRQTYAANDHVAFAEANRSFHETLVQLSGNAYLSKALRQFWHASRYLFLAAEHFRDYMEQSVAEHEVILAALEAGMPGAAKKAVEEHLHRCARDLSLQIAKKSPKLLR